MKDHPGYTEFSPTQDWWPPTREEIAMKAAERKPPPLRISDEEIEQLIDKIKGPRKS